MATPTDLIATSAGVALPSVVTASGRFITFLLTEHVMRVNEQEK